MFRLNSTLEPAGFLLALVPVTRAGGTPNAPSRPPGPSNPISPNTPPPAIPPPPLVGQISASFSTQIATGHAQTFGEQVTPPGFSTQVMSQGFTFERIVVNAYAFPRSSITLQQYINNTNDVQNATRWNYAQLSKMVDYTRFKSGRTMQFMASFSYPPKWLTWR
ncbi:MAG: hypothetical protein WDW38_006050 [Sanguina aurantia]